VGTLASRPTVNRGRGVAHAKSTRPMLQLGFSMIELLVTITIVAILFGIGIPSYRYVTNSNRATSEVNGLLADLQFARSEALKEGQTVTVCPSKDGATCLSSNVWNTGWIVFQDPDGNHAVASGETILRVQKGFPVTTDNFTSDNNIDYVMFNREGFVVAEQAVPNGYFTVTLNTTPTSQQWTRCLQISALGSMTTERYSAGVCQ
jgi:type IV fimbrial biogenesis protein FimT